MDKKMEKQKMWYALVTLQTCIDWNFKNNIVFLHMGTSPSLAMFGKSVVDMDIVTCCKWSNELKIKLLCLILWSSQQKQCSIVAYISNGHIFINVYSNCVFIVIMKVH
jgi:hypothetical protein